MAEYIEREAAIAAIMSEPPDAHYPHWYADKIKSIPSAYVAPVRHGRWILRHGRCICWGESETPTYENYGTCSVCGEDAEICTERCDYCPNCGAKMDGE